MNATNLLPIGSVIQVKEANKKMMIIGILQESDSVRYDYLGVLYPEGYLNDQQLFLFNHDDIETVEYLGFMNSEHQTLRTELDLYLSSQKAEEPEAE